MMGTQTTLCEYWTQCMLCSMDTVLSVCWTRCTLYLVYAILSVCCTWCTLYLVYAVLGVHSWSWHTEIQCNYLTLCSVMMVELWTRKRDGEWRWEWLGGYELICEIWGMTCLIGIRWSGTVPITGWMGVVPAISGMLNWLAYKILFCPSPSWCFLISSHLCLSHPQHCHDLRAQG